VPWAGTVQKRKHFKDKLMSRAVLSTDDVDKKTLREMRESMEGVGAAGAFGLLFLEVRRAAI
jgi:hypothetical protein